MDLGRRRATEVLLPVSDINIADKEGQTPLLVALHAGRRRLARLLLEGGAKCDGNDIKV